LAGAPAPGSSDYFQSYYEKLARVRAQPDRFREVLRLLEELRPAELSDSVLHYLPAGAALDITIYVVPNNHTNAYFHRGCAVVSFTHLDVDQGQLVMRPKEADAGWPLLPVLAHELHHAGQAGLPRPELDSQLECAYHLLGGLLGEGVATRFFTFITDSRWDEAQERVPVYRARLQELLWEVLDGSLSPDAARTRAFQEFHAPEGDGPAPVYVLGVHLVDAVCQQRGIEGVRELLARPLTALEAYNRASSVAAAYFDATLARRLAAAQVAG
jgi:hypothetical protein